MKNFKKALCRKHQKTSREENGQKKEPTKESKKLGRLLKEMGWKVEFEKWDGYKHIDIAIVEAKVNLEVDGLQHNQDYAQALADLQRTYHSFKKGYITLRIPNCLVKDENSIYKTAHFVNNFLNKSVETLNKEEIEAEKSGDIISWILKKISN
ncbi:MAG: DUF559 domain-containing protein [Nanoarchaeota archaeon]|nr:DUF559 domain-containing protein [Nanoarchaeota archaeon]MBU0977568.1 DUF559 domain-containing protein [Nanoarchaeota archaeon]